MPRVCTHCSDSSGFFWVRCFGTRCASLCKRARPAPPGIRPVYFRLARNFFCPPSLLPAPRSPARCRPPLPFVPCRRGAALRPGPALGSRGARGASTNPGTCVPTQNEGRKGKSHVWPLDAAIPPQLSLSPAPPAPPVPGAGRSSPGRTCCCSGLRRPHGSRFAAVGFGRASSGDGEALPWQLPAAHRPCRQRAGRGAAGGRAPSIPVPSPLRQLLPIPGGLGTRYAALLSLPWVPPAASAST